MMPEIDEKAIVSVAVNADGNVGARFTGVLNNLRAGRKTTWAGFGHHPVTIKSLPSSGKFHLSGTDIVSSAWVYLSSLIRIR